MSLTVLSVRRFKVKRNGEAGLEELSRVIDLPALPARGMTLAFSEAHRAVVQWVVQHVRTWEPGLSPPAVEVGTESEPAEHRDAALAAGWAAV